MTVRKSTVAPQRKFRVELSLKTEKTGLKKSDVKAWVADALVKQATREGWGHLLSVRVR